jgi:hypothetical protein
MSSSPTRSGSRQAAKPRGGPRPSPATAERRRRGRTREPEALMAGLGPIAYKTRGRPLDALRDRRRIIGDQVGGVRHSAARWTTLPSAPPGEIRCHRSEIRFPRAGDPTAVDGRFPWPPTAGKPPRGRRHILAARAGQSTTHGVAALASAPPMDDQQERRLGVLVFDETAEKGGACGGRFRRLGVGLASAFGLRSAPVMPPGRAGRLRSGGG